jgi:hypothetical protein
MFGPQNLEVFMMIASEFLALAPLRQDHCELCRHENLTTARRWPPVRLSLRSSRSAFLHPGASRCCGVAPRLALLVFGVHFVAASRRWHLAVAGVSALIWFAAVRFTL